MARKYIVEEFKKARRSTQKVAAASAIIFAAPTVDASLTLLQGVITNSPTTTLHVLATAPVVALGGKFISSQILYLNAVARSNADIDKLTDANHPGDAVSYAKAGRKIQKQCMDVEFKADPTINKTKAAARPLPVRPPITIERPINGKVDWLQVHAKIEQALKPHRWIS